MASHYLKGETKANTIFALCPPYPTLLSIIGIKPAARFAAEPAGGDVFLEQRAGAIFGVAEAVEQDVHDVHANVEANEIGELQRTHRVIHTQFQYGIHCFGR